MRATRNRVYGVTRIGGSNPSSSASFDSVELSALFLRTVDIAEMTMVSSFYVGKHKISGSYIHCRFGRVTSALKILHLEASVI